MENKKDLRHVGHGGKSNIYALGLSLKDGPGEQGRSNI
jgi:hypothetical protein